MSKFLTKYHTYIIALIAFATVLVQAVWGIQIPTYVYDIEAALGLGSIRITTAQVTGSSGAMTFLVAGALGVLAAVRAWGIDVPQEVDVMVASLGGVTMTNAIKKA